MILFNGETGSLGRYMRPALAAANARGGALVSRLEDPSTLDAELASVTIDARASVCLVHLAARVSVPECEKNPDAAESINVHATARVARQFISWAKARQLAPSVVYVSSGHVYAQQPVGRRIREDDALAPRSVYAKTKAAAETALRSVAKDLGVPFVVARVFGLIAPIQPPHYVLPGLIRRARARELAGVPGADGVRDYLDARDVCRVLVDLAGRLRAKEGLPETLNVCAGEGVTIRALLKEVLHALGDEAHPEIQAAPGRPDDIPHIVGDPSALERLIGKNARSITLAETVRDALALT